MIDQIITRCFFDNACSAGQPKRKRRRKGSDHVPEKKTSATGGARRRAADLGCLLLGSACLGASVSLFSAPNDIAPGGVTGLATVLHRVVGLPIGVLCILLNLPLLAAAWRVLWRRFLRRSIAGLLLSSVATDLLGRVARPVTNDLMLAALCAGVLTGAGLGLILSRGATTGGSEIAARLLERRFPHVPIGRLIARLGLSPYQRALLPLCRKLTPDEVFIPLRQHIGKPAVPIRSVGERLACGDLLAQAAPNALSANIHASMDGVVTEIRPDGIRLRRKEACTE